MPVCRRENCSLASRLRETVPFRTKTVSLFPTFWRGATITVDPASSCFGGDGGVGGGGGGGRVELVHYVGGDGVLGPDVVEGVGGFEGCVEEEGKGEEEEEGGEEAGWRFHCGRWAMR